jgi:hypothetical protein
VERIGELGMRTIDEILDGFVGGRLGELAERGVLCATSARIHIPITKHTGKLGDLGIVCSNRNTNLPIKPSAHIPLLCTSTHFRKSSRLLLVKQMCVVSQSIVPAVSAQLRGFSRSNGWTGWNVLFSFLWGGQCESTMSMPARTGEALLWIGVKTTSLSPTSPSLLLMTSNIPRLPTQRCFASAPANK